MPDRTLIVLLLLCLCPALPALAQEDAGSAQEDPNRPALPDIAPREVEIRGQLEISFPSLQRQPLIGFNPPPRVTEIPAGRRPYAGDYDQEKADLPPTPLSRPEPPRVAALVGAPPQRGEFETSAGRYFTRLVRARTDLPLTRHEGLYGRLDYRGSDGHTPFETAADLRNPFDALSAGAGLQTHRARFALGAEGTGFYDRYTLYGTSLPLTIPVGTPDPQPTRIGQGGSGTLWFRTQGEARTTFETQLRYSRAHFETDVFEDDAQNVFYDRSERRFDLSADLGVPTSLGDLLMAGQFARALSDAAENLLVDAGLGMRLGSGASYDLTVGARYLTSSAENTQRGIDRTIGYLSPDVRLDLYPARNVRLYVQNRPGAEVHALAELYRQNPFLVDRPHTEPTLRVVDAAAGGSLFAGLLQLSARVGYQWMPNYRFFEQAASAETYPYERGLATAAYDEAAIFLVGGDVSVVLPAGFHATFGATYRNGRLTAADTVIPYFGPLIGQAMVSYAFARSRGLLQLTGAFESTRYADRTETLLVGSFFDLDVLASYNLTPSIGLLMRFENLGAGSVERWDHYPQTPNIVTAGLRIRW